MAQRHNAEFQTHFHAALGTLLDHVADEECHNALGLIVLDDLDGVGGIVGLAQHDGHARNITRDQRDAQRTDDGVGNETDAGIGSVGIAALDIFQTLEDLGADGGGKTGVERLAQILLIGDEAFQDAHAGGQIAQLRDLDARSGIDRGEVVRGVRERECLVCAILGDCVIDRTLGQAGDGIRAAIDQIG